jgi:hypothetical protein
VLWLTRARVANRAFTDMANWEWVVGFDGNRPRWGPMDERAPVLEDDAGLMRGSAIYMPGIDRYLMVTNHTARNSGNITMWEAPEPWGPWEIFWMTLWPRTIPTPVGGLRAGSPEVDGVERTLRRLRVVPPRPWNSVESS